MVCVLDLEIKKIAIKPEKIKDNCLYFYFANAEVNWRFSGFNSSIAVVTDEPGIILKHAPHAAVIEVSNVWQAYWDFVQYYRSLFRIPVIGVTGTCGKTTTTEMIRTILSRIYHRTYSSYDGNNKWALVSPEI